MNKEEVLKTLDTYNFDKKEILILSGASMVVNEMKDTTNDIDIAVSKEYEKKLLKKYNCKLKETKNDYNVYSIDNVIEFSTCYYDFSYDIINEYKFQKPSEILKLKESLNRGKDENDIKLIKNHLALNSINSLTLAYLGDAVYELYIRKYLIKKGIVKVNELQKAATSYVSAKSQSFYLEKMINDNFFEEEEKTIIKRARNHKSHGNKNTDIITYKK